MFNGIPEKGCSIWGTGGGSSEPSFLSTSSDHFFKPLRFLSDRREPGLEPGRELGREPDSFTTISGTLREEDAPSDRIVRVSSPTESDGPSRENIGADTCLSLRPGDAALVLKDRLFEAVGASAVGNETDRFARGAATVFSKGTA